MKPIQILLFLISVFLVLMALGALFPENGVKIGDHLALRFIRPEEILSEDTTEYADISGIILNSKAATESPATSADDVSPGLSPDSAGDSPAQAYSPAEHPVSAGSMPADTIRASERELKKVIQPLELPPGNPVVLAPFFEKISKTGEEHSLVRVLHYGDSQIEADRMTSFFRYRMQARFGGSGCGLIPVVPLYNGKSSIRQSSSGTWKRYTGFANRDPALGHKRYGALFSFSKFQAEDTVAGSSASLHFSPSPLGYRSTRHFNRFSLFLGSVPANVNLTVLAGDSLVDSLTLFPKKMYLHYTWTTSTTPREFVLRFTGRTSPEIYGITIDNSWGVAVDNIPLRGSSGLVFSKVDTVLLKQMYLDLNVGMIILQFGGNVIPYLKNDYDYYDRLFRRELGVISRMLPAIPVIVIGPSDMSMKEGGRYVTYPNLEPIRDVLRKAALDSGCAFWDMYEAMGGRNSMPSWVFADPPLAISDFVHFNPRGARIIGGMFYNAFIHEYNQWLTDNRHQMAQHSLSRETGP